MQSYQRLQRFGSRVKPRRGAYRALVEDDSSHHANVASGAEVAEACFYPSSLEPVHRGTRPAPWATVTFPRREHDDGMACGSRSRNTRRTLHAVSGTGAAGIARVTSCVTRVCVHAPPRYQL